MNIDVSKYLPKPLLDYGQGWTNFANVIQTITNDFIDKIKGVRYFYNPERTQLSNEVAYFTGAYIALEDSERDIRDKIGNAFYTHKNLADFKRVWKLLIDDICGSDSAIYNGLINYNVFTWDSSFWDSGSMYESIEISDNDKPKGTIYIDLGLVPTSGMLESLKQQLTPMKPVYYYVVIGQKIPISADEFTWDESRWDSFSEWENAIVSTNKFDVYLIL